MIAETSAPSATAPGAATASEPPDLSAVLQAHRDLTALHKPEIQDFCRRHRLPCSGTKEEIQGRILDFLLPDSLAPNPVALRAAFDFIDAQKEHGEQHLFLFRLPKKRRGMLAELADPEHLWRRLDAAAREEPGLRLADDPLRPLFPAEPTLVRVIHRTEPHELVLQWEETRMWLQQHREGRRIDLRRHSERAVSFFRLDLETGDAELRLPYQRPNAQVSLQQERRRLEARVRHLVQLERFEPVLVEPILHGLLLKQGRARVQEWRVEWATEGRVEGTAEPTVVQRLPLHLSEFFAERAKVDWPLGDGDDPRFLRIELDGRLDSVSLPRLCSREEMDRILGAIRHHADRKMATPKLEKAARKNRDLRPALEKIDQQIHNLGKRQVRLDELARESRIPEDRMEAASRWLAQEYEGAFRLRYRVRCPETGKPEKDDRKATRWYETRAEIPEVVECSYRDGSHPARDTVEAVLDFDPDLRGPQLAVRLDRTAVEWGLLQETEEGRGSRFRSPLAGAILLVVFSSLTLLLSLAIASLFPQDYVAEVVVEGVVVTITALGPILKVSADVAGEPAQEMLRDLLIWLAGKVWP